jgi:hypothetical protein
LTETAVELARRIVKRGALDENGKPVLVKYEKDEELDWLTVAADKVMELAAEGNMLAVEHLANRFDGKVREQVEVTTNTNVKVRYESYEEVRAAIIECNCDYSAMLVYDQAIDYLKEGQLVLGLNTVPMKETTARKR